MATATDDVPVVIAQRHSAEPAPARSAGKEVPETRSFDVLLVSAAEYRIDGIFRYVAEQLPEPGDLITVVDALDGRERQARVRRVSPDDAYSIYAVDAAEHAREWSLGPRERSRRAETATDRANARRGWLRRRRRRLASS
jgi:hypothetical protein